MDLKRPDVTIELLGKEYDFFLTLMGSDELRQKYGSTPEAMNKLLDLYKMPILIRDEQGEIDVAASTEAQRVRGEAMSNGGYDIILDFLHACIIHNAYDEDGEPIKDVKIPSVRAMKLKLGLKDISDFFIKLANALALSVGAGETGEATGGTPTPETN